MARLPGKSGDTFLPATQIMKMEILLRPLNLSKSLLVTSGATVNKGPNETGVHNGHPGWETAGVRPGSVFSSWS